MVVTYSEVLQNMLQLTKETSK